jgi:hypothetical protein
MDVIRGIVNWSLKVKIERSEGLVSRAPPACCTFLASPCERGGLPLIKGIKS